MLLVISVITTRNGMFDAFLTYHRHRVGRRAQQKVESSHGNGENEEHQGPEIGLLYQFLARELENLDQLSKKPTLQCIASFNIPLAVGIRDSLPCWNRELTSCPNSRDKCQHIKNPVTAVFIKHKAQAKCQALGLCLRGCL